MEPKKTNFNTWLLIIIIILLAAILIVFATNRTIVENAFPKQASQQATTTVPVNNSSPQTSTNSNTQQNQNSEYLKVYSTDDFSFNYENDAQVKVITTPQGITYGVSVNGGDFADGVDYFVGSPSLRYSDIASCQNIVINNKNFLKCPSEVSGDHIYFYSKGNKNLMLDIQSPHMLPKTQDSYIDIGSVEIK